MSLMNALSRIARSYTEDLVKDFQRLKNRDSLEALMAACALIAAADGYVSGDERRKVVSFIQSSPVFGVFDVETAVILFNKYAATFQTDSQIGRMNVYQTLNRFKGSSELRRTIIRVGIMLAESPEEKEAARCLCTEMGERPESFPELRDIGAVRMRDIPFVGREQNPSFAQIERMYREGLTDQRKPAPSSPSTGFKADELKDFFKS